MPLVEPRTPKPNAWNQNRDISGYGDLYRKASKTYRNLVSPDQNLLSVPFRQHLCLESMKHGNDSNPFSNPDGTYRTVTVTPLEAL